MRVPVTYLVDFENVGNHWADVLASAGDGDTAVLFYSDNSPKAMLEQLEKIERRGVAIKFRKCLAGRNGLDFQLSSELGFLLGKLGMGDGYKIISDDVGYDVLAGYWKSAGASVDRVGTSPKDRAAAPGADGESAWSMAASVLDGPMTEMGLTKYERAHVLGCAKACLLECRDPEARYRKFKDDTCRIKGRALWNQLDAGIGPALSDLFGGPG